MSRQSRFRRMAELNPSMDFQPRSTVTYGKRNKPLLLRGTHFIRSDPYDLPQDVPQPETPIPQRRMPAVRLPEPNDSPLSENELEAVYGKSPTRIANASPAVSDSGGRASLERTFEAHQACRSASSRELDTGEHIAEHVARGPGKSAKPMQKVASNFRTTKVASTTVEPQPANGPVAGPLKRVHRREIIQTDFAKPKISRRKIATPVRRLPVDELHMVASIPDQPDYLNDPDSSFVGIQVQDPIADGSSPLQKLEISPTIGKPPAKGAPLTSLRKRLKTPSYTHKSNAALRKKDHDEKPKSVEVERKVGDGFDVSELVIRPCRVKRQRRNGAALLRGFGALQLQNGPLPEVKFEEWSGDVKAEPSIEVTHANDHQEVAEIGTLPHGYSGYKSDRQLTSSDSFFDEAIRAQLSSVSAPKRVFEISSDESEEEDEEEDEDEDGDDSDAEPPELRDEEKDCDPSHDQDSSLSYGISPIEAAIPTSFQRVEQLPSSNANEVTASTSLKPERPRNVGVTLDFRSSWTPVTARQTLRKPRLMEVDETIMDDPFVEQAQGLPTMSNGGIHEPMSTSDHRRISMGIPVSHIRRPRSILRASTPVLRGRPGTRPEDTIANTRRNSNIAIESAHFPGPAAVPRKERLSSVKSLSWKDLPEKANERHPDVEPDIPYQTTSRRKTAVTLEDGRETYYGITSHQLQQPLRVSTPQTHRPSNRPDAAASHFFAQRRKESELHVLDSSGAVLETSPQRKPDYMTNLGMELNVVHRNEETTWTSSQSLPAVQPPKSLKSLTRSVSKEFGTISQATRRRPSLHFQSPVKMAAQRSRAA